MLAAMTRLQIPGSVAAGLLSLMLVLGSTAAEVPRVLNPKFTGSQSCASTSCHGGGANRNEAIIYGRKDRHAIARGILGKGTSLRIAEALQITGDPLKAAQCTVCHAPMHTVPAERLVKDLTPDNSVGCEACHGPAEPWLRFHTRPDVTFQQMVDAGLRNLNDLYGRANTCVACHLNIDRTISDAGHPELYFEMDAQALAQPPHYIDARPAIGPRSWLTGQAVALREMSWKLAGKRDEALVPRWKALVWLLRKTDAGRKALPETEEFSAMKSAADDLARSAARAPWTNDDVTKLLDNYLALEVEFRNAKAESTAQLSRRAEVLAPALYSLWRGRKKVGANDPDTSDTLLQNILRRAREGESFDPEFFADALKDLRAATPKS